ncbi:MAG: leucine-rich repeat protein [Ruminococcus sp.]|nr:leucine-rich repeat protein [Ruminococcus sp.]
MNIISKIYFLYIKNTKKQRIVIPNWIREIPPGAFRDNQYIKEVYIAESIQKIESDAFMNCNSLRKINFKGSVRYISSSAFPKNENICFSFAKTIDETDRNRMRVYVNKASIHRNAVFSDAETINATNVIESIIAPEIEDITDTKLTDNIVSDAAEVQSVPEQELIVEATVAEEMVTSEIGDENYESLCFENNNEEIEPSETMSDADTEVYEEEKVIEKKVIGASDEAVETEQDEFVESDYENSVETEVNEESEDNDELVKVAEQSKFIEDIPSETACTGVIVNVDEETEPKAIEITAQNESVNQEAKSIQVKTISEEPIEEDSNFDEEQSDERDISEINKDEEVESYDEVIPSRPARSASEKSIAAVKSTKKVADNKEDIRQSDLKKYYSKQSVSDIESSDLFISSLIEKYSVLENKYGYEVPLGMIDMTKEEYEKLARYVHGFITTEAPIVSLTSFLCSVFLVKTVANYDHNNNFWGAVSILLKCDENSATKYLKEALLYFCSSEKVYFHYYKNRHSYARTVLIHSIINRSTLNTVIDFIREFYIEEMRESYDSNNVQSYIDLFVDEMVKDLSKISDDNSSGSDMGGIYKVSLAFKTACREFPDAVKDGLKCLLFNIDAYYHRTSDVSYSPAVFNKYFKRWKISDIVLKRNNTNGQNQKAHKNGIKHNKKNIQQLERLARLQRCVYYIDEDYRLYLYIPQQEIPSEYAESGVQIRLFNNDEALFEYNQECDVFGIFRFYTGEMQIELSKFYKNLSIRIVTGAEEVIFDSKSQLYRNYIVFDTNLDEYTGRNIPRERFYVLSGTNEEFFADANYNTYKYSDYMVHSLDTDGECEILVGTHSVFDSFDSSTDIQLHIDKSRLVKSVKAYVAGKEYRVYSSLPQIRCKIENDNADKYILDVNDAHINADEIFGDTREAVLDLNKIFNTEKKNFINICLREKGNKKSICEWRIAILEDFEYSLDKAYYYTDKTVQLLDLYASDAQFEIEDYPYNLAVNSLRKIAVNGVCGNTEFYIDIKLPMIYWAFDEDYNSLMGTKYIPSEVFEKNSNIIMELPVGSFNIWAINDTTQRQLSIQSGKLNLSDFRVSGSDYTTIGLRSEKIGELKLFELIHKPSVRELSVACDGNELTVSYIQIGKCPMNILIKNNDGDKVFTKSFSPQNNGEVVITENISELENGIYSVEVSQLVADDFGFSATKKLIGTYAITKGNVFEVYCQSKNGMLKPYCCIFDGEIKKRANNFYCENIESKDNGESGVYTANAFYNNRNGVKVYFEDANPLRIELLEKNGNIITFTIADNDGDGLLYENARGYLCCDKVGSRDYKAYSLPDHYVIKI